MKSGAHINCALAVVLSWCWVDLYFLPAPGFPRFIPALVDRVAVSSSPSMVHLNASSDPAVTVERPQDLVEFGSEANPLQRIDHLFEQHKTNQRHHWHRSVESTSQYGDGSYKFRPRLRQAAKSMPFERTPPAPTLRCVGMHVESQPSRLDSSPHCTSPHLT